MRVIAGKAKRLILVTPRGMKTRPTTDRIKETLFNMLQPELFGVRFLDLFSGSGQIGIEALSRGASEAVFVESDREAVKCIRENLSHTRLEAQATVIDRDAVTALGRLRGKEEFDLVFMDPPYDSDLAEQCLALLISYGLITADSLIIVESDIKKDFSFAEKLGYTIEREKNYKTNKHVFLRAGGKE